MRSGGQLPPAPAYQLTARFFLGVVLIIVAIRYGVVKLHGRHGAPTRLARRHPPALSAGIDVACQYCQVRGASPRCTVRSSTSTHTVLASVMDRSYASMMLCVSDQGPNKLNSLRTGYS